MSMRSGKQFALDRADELGHCLALFGLEGLVLAEGVGLQEQGGDAQGERVAVGVYGVDDLLVSQLDMLFQESVVV